MKGVSFCEFISGIFRCKTIKEIDAYAKGHEIIKEEKWDYVKIV